jgi:hypothetical protein
MKTKAMMMMMGCAGSMRNPIHRDYFPIDEYVSLPDTGTATVTGQAFLKTRGGEVRFAAGEVVLLNPITSYSTQWYNESYIKNFIMEEGDIRQNQFIRKTTADATGRFCFKNVPRGRYYLVSSVVWEVPYGRYSMMLPQGGLIAKPIEVFDDQTQDVILTR